MSRSAAKSCGGYRGGRAGASSPSNPKLLTRFAVEIPPGPQ